MSACKCSGFDCQNMDNTITDRDLHGYCEEDGNIVMDDDIDYIDEEIVE